MTQFDNLEAKEINVGSTTGVNVLTVNVRATDSGINVLDNSSNNTIIKLRKTNSDNGLIQMYDGGSEKIRLWSSSTSFVKNALRSGDGSDEASAQLNVVSTTKGFLPPRVTTTQRDAISSPATGLMVYNTTTNTMQFYNGSVWGNI